MWWVDCGFFLLGNLHLLYYRSSKNKTNDFVLNFRVELMKDDQIK